MPIPPDDRPGSPSAPKLASEARRASCALAVGLAVGFVVLVIAVAFFEASTPELMVTVILTAWIGLAITYCCLTYTVFRRLAGPALTEALVASSPQARSSRWLLGGGAASWSVQFSLAALVTGVALARGFEWASGAVVVTTGLVLVGCAWCTVQLTYALHYGRIDIPEPAFEFPDRSRREFWDYLYLSLSVGTTFSTSDVQVVTTDARRVVTGHAVINFAFSAVVVALIVAVIGG